MGPKHKTKLDQFTGLDRVQSSRDAIKALQQGENCENSDSEELRKSVEK